MSKTENFLNSLSYFKYRFDNEFNYYEKSYFI